MIKRKLYSLNDKGTKVSHGIFDESIKSVLEFNKIDVHYDLVEVDGSVSSGHISNNGIRMSYIGLRSLKPESLSSDFYIPCSLNEDVSNEDINKIL